MNKSSFSFILRCSLVGLASTIVFGNSSLTSSAQTYRYPSLQPPLDNITAQNPTLTPQEIQNRLVGQWQLQGVFFVPITVVFTAQGRGFLLTPTFALNAQSNPTAYEFTYQINGTNQPLQIDLAEPTEEAIKTIFEFTSDGRIRVELVGIKPGEPRPTEFTTGSLLLNRVSNLTALPRNTEIVNSPEAKIRTKERSGRYTIGSILRAQQAYYLEKETFIADLKELGLGFDSDQPSNYNLEIISTGNLKQEIFVTATAKITGIRSFAGAVFLIKDGEDDTTVTGICETIEPSMIAPARPTLNGKEIQCASGSRVPEDEVRSRSPFGF
jgi:hypothetical protein